MAGGMRGPARRADADADSASPAHWAAVRKECSAERVARYLSLVVKVVEDVLDLLLGEALPDHCCELPDVELSDSLLVVVLEELLEVVALLFDGLLDFADYLLDHFLASDLGCWTDIEVLQEIADGQVAAPCGIEPEEDHVDLFGRQELAEQVPEFQAAQVGVFLLALFFFDQSEDVHLEFGELLLQNLQVLLCPLPELVIQLFPLEIPLQFFMGYATRCPERKVVLAQKASRAE